jgi:transposase
MREQGVHHLIAYCLSDTCRHSALIDVSSYPADTEVPSSSGAPGAAGVLTCVHCKERTFPRYGGGAFVLTFWH